MRRTRLTQLSRKRPRENSIVKFPQKAPLFFLRIPLIIRYLLQNFYQIFKVWNRNEDPNRLGKKYDWRKSDRMFSLPFGLKMNCATLAALRRNLGLAIGGDSKVDRWNFHYPRIERTVTRFKRKKGGRKEKTEAKIGTRSNLIFFLLYSKLRIFANLL